MSTKQLQKSSQRENNSNNFTRIGIYSFTILILALIVIFVSKKIKSKSLLNNDEIQVISEQILASESVFTDKVSESFSSESAFTYKASESFSFGKLVKQFFGSMNKSILEHKAQAEKLKFPKIRI